MVLRFLVFRPVLVSILYFYLMAHNYLLLVQVQGIPTYGMKLKK